MIEIIPTNTCPPDFAELARRSEALARFARDIQLDVADGVFVPDLSWPYREGQWEELEAMASAGALLPHSGPVRYEAHLMADDPQHVGELLARVGCRRIIPHVEVFENEAAFRSVSAVWRAAGAKEVGLAILIDTPLSALLPYIPHCDVVQVMSIATLGKQGAPYDPRAIARVAELHAQHPLLTIAVDGGVSLSNIADLVRAGASRFGVGGAIAKAAEPARAYEELRAAGERGRVS